MTKEEAEAKSKEHTDIAATKYAYGSAQITHEGLAAGYAEHAAGASSTPSLMKLTEDEAKESQRSGVHVPIQWTDEAKAGSPYAGISNEHVRYTIGYAAARSLAQHSLMSKDDADAKASALDDADQADKTADPMVRAFARGAADGYRAHAIQSPKVEPPTPPAPKPKASKEVFTPSEPNPFRPGGSEYESHKANQEKHGFTWAGSISEKSNEVRANAWDKAYQDERQRTILTGITPGRARNKGLTHEAKAARISGDGAKGAHLGRAVADKDYAAAVDAAGGQPDFSKTGPTKNPFTGARGKQWEAARDEAVETARSKNMDSLSADEQAAHLDASAINRQGTTFTKESGLAEGYRQHARELRARQGGQDQATSVTHEGVQLKGLTPKAQESVKEGISTFHQAFPNAPRINKVEVNPDQSALGNKSHTSITFSPLINDEQGLADRQKSAGGVFAGDGTPKTVAIHEYAHVIDGQLARDHPEQAAKLNAYLNEPITYKVAGHDVSAPRWQAGDGSAPTAYAGENQFEYTAEALTDSVLNGDKAKPTSKAVAAIFHEAYGGGTPKATTSTDRPNGTPADKSKYLPGSPKYKAFNEGHAEAVATAQREGLSETEARSRSATSANMPVEHSDKTGRALNEGRAAGYLQHAETVKGGGKPEPTPPTPPEPKPTNNNPNPLGEILPGGISKVDPKTGITYTYHERNKGYDDHSIYVQAHKDGSSLGDTTANPRYGFKNLSGPVVSIWKYQVADDARRQGISRKMIETIHDQNPDAKIAHSGFVSDAGEKFADSMDPKYNRIMHSGMNRFERTKGNGDKGPPIIPPEQPYIVDTALSAAENDTRFGSPPEDLAVRHEHQRSGQQALRARWQPVVPHRAHVSRRVLHPRRAEEDPPARPRQQPDQGAGHADRRQRSRRGRQGRQLLPRLREAATGDRRGGAGQPLRPGHLRPPILQPRPRPS